MNFARVTSYFIELDLSSTELIEIGENVKIENELIGHVGWIKDHLIRVDLINPIHVYSLLKNGISLNQIKFID